MTRKKPTYVYVDGFNLYYGALKGTTFRWLDLYALCSKLLKHNDIVCIKYFTARVSARGSKKDAPVHQDIYLRALRTCPQVEIYFGHFLSHPRVMPLADGSGTAKVIRTEEKGSDVNLASHLVFDACQNRFEAAAVVSNDSDLAEPVRLVSTELRKPVGILNPHQHPSVELKKLASFYRDIREGALKDSQFPDTLTDDVGTIARPTGW